MPLRGVGCLEDRAPRDEDVGAGGDGERRRLGLDTPVDLDPERQVPRTSDLLGALHLRKVLGHERLAPNPAVIVITSSRSIRSSR